MTDHLGISHEACWAKTTEDGRPGISVRDHCLNVGFIAERLLARLLPAVRGLFPLRGVATLAAFHDIGKVSPGFQQKCEEWNRRFRHRQDVFEANHPRITQEFVAHMRMAELYLWAEALGAHHGRVQGPLIGDCGGPEWEAQRQCLAETLESALGAIPDVDADRNLEWLFAGLVAVADWLGSDERFFPVEATAPFKQEPAGETATRAVMSIGFAALKPATGLGFGDLFHDDSGPLSPNALQKRVMDVAVDPGVYVIEGAMGCGKTEAALWVAYRLISLGLANGLYFALPTQTTSNRIHERVGRFLDKAYGGAPPPHILAHSNSWLMEKTAIPDMRPSDPQAEADTGEARSWFASSRRALLAQYAVGTVDQALLGVVAAKHFFVRQFALAGKVVVLDEVHSYDLYTGTLVNELVKKLLELKCAVVILSATLTAAQRARLLGETGAHPDSLPYPLLSARKPPNSAVPFQVEDDGKVKRIRVRCVPVVSDAYVRMARLCADHARKGQCVVWIRNTVPEAQAAFRAVCAEVTQGERNDGLEVGLLHSRFLQYQRERNENKWLVMLDKSGKTRPQGCVLVATQVVEQSVDIDADFMVTDLAPTDMLLQRIGRLHRHERPNRRIQPRVLIPYPAALDGASDAHDIRQALGGIGRVYAPYVLLRALQQWKKKQSALVLPADIRNILEATYSEPEAGEPEAWRALFDAMQRKRDVLRNRAVAAMNIKGQDLLEDEEGVQTRYSDQPQLTLLIVTALREHNRDRVELRLPNGDHQIVMTRKFDIEVARALHKNTVKIPSWWLQGVDFRSLPALNTYFRGKMAWAFLEGNKLQVGGDKDSPLVLRYSPELGVWMEKAPPRPVTTDAEDEYESCE